MSEPARLLAALTFLDGAGEFALELTREAVREDCFEAAFRDTVLEPCFRACLRRDSGV